MTSDNSHAAGTEFQAEERAILRLQDYKRFL